MNPIALLVGVGAALIYTLLDKPKKEGNDAHVNTGNERDGKERPSETTGDAPTTEGETDSSIQPNEGNGLHPQG